MRQGHERLISAIKKFYARHEILVDRYKVSVTHIISDLFLETLYRHDHDLHVIMEVFYVCLILF